MEDKHGKEESSRGRTRIRYADDIEGCVGSTYRRTPHRHPQSSSVPVRTISRSRTVDPGLVLPRHYKTLSIKTGESKPKIEGKGRREKNGDIDFADTVWHKLSVQEILVRLSSSLTRGLSNEQVIKRLKLYGPNRPSSPPSRWLRMTASYFFGGFGPVLFIAAILVYIAWEPLGQPPQQSNLALAIVLTCVFFMQAAFSFCQDFSSSRTTASIKTLLPEHCLVLRDGTQQSIPGADIVPGDVLCIKTGDRLPADVRFIDTSNDARFDRAILTGVTVPMHGSVESTDDNYLETACIGAAGTHCVAGSALGLVVATGDRTVFGRVTKLTATSKEGMTSLQREISHFVKVVASIMVSVIFLVIIVWIAWLRRSHPTWISVSQLIVDCVTVAVAFVPEGLPIAITSSLIITASILKRNKILCKSLKTVETLGAVTIICSDKTGTLSKNQMTVTDCMVGRVAMIATQAAQVESAKNDGPEELGIMGAVCNAGEFDTVAMHLPLAERKTNGDATDQAILRFAGCLVPVSETRKHFQTILKIAFNSKNKFMMQIVQPPGSKSSDDSNGTDASNGHDESSASSNPSAPLILMIKGAPDVLIDRCDAIIADNGKSTRLITIDDREIVERQKNRWASQGKRIILFARKKLPALLHLLSTTSREYEELIMQEATYGLELVGLVAITDSIRSEIPDVVKTLRAAGIRIFMITGDFKLTAQAIAIRCGIITQPDAIDDASALSTDDKWCEQATSTEKDPEGIAARAIALDGAEMDQLGIREWDKLCKYREIVFARTTPEQKLRIVKEFQAREEVVGMTGDGVNDAPSLKASDIGIAIGSGSEVAMEAADMVLLDSFSAIIEAVRCGRVVFDNLKKTICYLMPAGTFSEVWPIITTVIFGMPQILSSFLMIIICCFTDCAAATVIAYEQPERDVLASKPRRMKKDRLVNWKLLLHAYGFLGIVMATCSFTVSYWYADRRGLPFSTLALGFGNVPNELSQEYYAKVLNEASSIYFMNLVIMQCFNLLAIRTRRLSLLQHPPLFRPETRNYKLFLAILFALAVAFLFLYAPKLQTVLGTSNVPVENFLLPIAFGMAMLLLDEARKAAVRRWPTGFLAKVAW